MTRRRGHRIDVAESVRWRQDAKSDVGRQTLASPLHHDQTSPPQSENKLRIAVRGLAGAAMICVEASLSSQADLDHFHALAAGIAPDAHRSLVVPCSCLHERFLFSAPLIYAVFWRG